jgi:hypothetical protein
MTDVVRMGVIGAGSIAVRGILPHLALSDVHDRVRLAAVCDPVPGRAEAAAARFGIERAFTDYLDLLEHGNVDAVTTASPIGLHYEQGRLALTAGKHVHFNKTMTTTTAQATELIELARKNNLRIVASPGQMLFPITSTSNSSSPRAPWVSSAGPPVVLLWAPITKTSPCDTAMMCSPTSTPRGTSANLAVVHCMM